MQLQQLVLQSRYRMRLLESDSVLVLHRRTVLVHGRSESSHLLLRLFRRSRRLIQLSRHLLDHPRVGGCLTLQRFQLAAGTCYFTTQNHFPLFVALSNGSENDLTICCKFFNYQ